MTPKTFRESHPDLFFLNAGDLAGLSEFLHSRAIFETDETALSLERAGDGNMNCTLRLVTSRRSLIVKQSRPWVEKYPQFSAPWDRALREAEFYRLAAACPPVAPYLPRLLHCDPASRTLVLEDFGAGGDYTGLYRGETLGSDIVLPLADFLSELHHAYLRSQPRPSLPNREMRILNHTHIFILPLDKGLPLQLDLVEPGLQRIADRLRSLPAFCDAVRTLGQDHYLRDGPCLLHGDFFPGSLVRTPTGPRVIDPEFCFFGPPEFDVGVFLAHVLLGGQAIELWSLFRDRYAPPPGFRDELALMFAGTEIMRRLIGYAQLPLAWAPGARVALLDLARELVLDPSRALGPYPEIQGRTFQPLHAPREPNPS